MIDEPEAKFGGDLPLQRLKLGIDEFDDLAGFDVDHMIVMCFRRRFIAGAAIAEIVAVKDARLFEQSDGAIDRGNRNAGIDCNCTLMQLFNVGMVCAFRQYARNYPPLFGDAQATFRAESFYIDCLSHKSPN